MDSKKGKLKVGQKASAKQVKYAKAKEFNKYAIEKGISPNFDSIRKADGYMAESDAMTKFYSNPDNVRKMKEGQKEYFSSKGSPAKNINQQIDPATGQMMQPQPITNRAGVPSRSINDLQGINTIQDPGMQSSQQADAFQKFNNIAQYNPPPAMKYGSPAKNYTKPAMIIDKSAGGLAEAGKAVEGGVQNKISQDSASDNEELINFLMNQK